MGTMTTTHAAQIADLINERNQLVKRYTLSDILARSADFEYDIIDNRIVACVEVRKVQWYQWEVCHLSVQPDLEGRGLGAQMVRRAEDRAVKDGAKVIQCTIRADNTPSMRVFAKQGFKQVSAFYYNATGNNVTVWQKVVSPHAEPIPESNRPLA